MDFVREFIIFGFKQAYACIFGAFLLFIMIGTKFWYPLEFIHRYDFIFVPAIVFQVCLLIFKLESLREALVIVLFHFVATVMELFKTSDSIASWTYPEEYVFGIANVPLFTGFMYSAVGSYIARIWRIFDFRFSNYPPSWVATLIVLLVYINFFTHHYTFDIRWVLLLATLIFFWKTKIFFRVEKHYRHMPLLLGWLLVALFIWLAENIATYVNIWIYPNQKDEWSMVSIGKMSSWYLLMMLSFVLITLVNSIKLMERSNLNTKSD